MSLKLYMRKEFLGFHFKGPGLLVPLLVAAGCALWIGYSDQQHARQLAKDLVSTLPTWSAVVLGLIVASVTFQLGTFSVQDLEAFAKDDEGLERFRLIKGAMLWNSLSALVLTIVAFVMKIAGKDIPSFSRAGIVALGALGGFIGGYLTVNLWCAILAAHDHADWKLELARRRRRNEAAGAAQKELEKE